MTYIKNSYADVSTELKDVLHGLVRLHVSLGRMEKANISTRGWSYNDLVESVIAISSEDQDLCVRQSRCIETVFDALDAVTDIGKSAVDYLVSIKGFKQCK